MAHPMTHLQSSTEPRQAAVFFILVTVVLDMLSFGIIIPVLPKLVEEFLGGDTAQAAEIYGLMGTSWALMQFVCSPIQGALSDRFGRRPVVLLSNLGLGLDFILMALAPSLAWLFAGRVISGIASSSFSTAGAYIADVTPPDKRAAAFGMMGASFGLGLCWVLRWVGCWAPSIPAGPFGARRRRVCSTPVTGSLCSRNRSRWRSGRRSGGNGPIRPAR